jgi:DNA repair protein RadC
MNFIRDPNGNYSADAPATPADIVRLATEILERDMFGAQLTSPADTKKYLVCKLGAMERECFAVIFLNARHRVIAYEELFYGTIDGASVHPREVVKAALRHNSAAIILAHNHPSGVPEPSKSDEQITTRLKESLALMDVRVLDHIVIGGAETVSFAERGLL